jgi:Na+-transporting NADH:ubiquinone oxidoreductase subunit B
MTAPSRPLNAWHLTRRQLMAYRARLAMPFKGGQERATAPFVRSMINTHHLLFGFVLASIPAWLIGVWNLGYQVEQVLRHTGGATLAGWQGVVHGLLMAPAGSGVDTAGPLACVLLGLTWHLPLLGVVLLVTLFWELLFANRAGHGIDPGWLMTAWLFVLLLPPAVSPLLAAVGVSFGVVLGGHIFGGSGRYVVSPALLGVLFLSVGYPGLFDIGVPVGGVPVGGVPIEGLVVNTTWAAVAVEGEAAAGDFMMTLLGSQRGALGTGSALACLAGAACLLAIGAASARTLIGALAGLVVGASLANLGASDDPVRALGWHWHLVLGNLAFAVVFVATDPSTAPLTRPVRWVHGFMVGLLAVLLRTFDPSHPEAGLQAVLLAGLMVPLLDYLALRRHAPAWGTS